MSTIRANSITNSAGTGAPDFPNGLTSGGVTVAPDTQTFTASGSITAGDVVAVNPDGTVSKTGPDTNGKTTGLLTTFSSGTSGVGFNNIFGTVWLSGTTFVTIRLDSSTSVISAAVGTINPDGTSTLGSYVTGPTASNGSYGPAIKVSSDSFAIFWVNSSSQAYVTIGRVVSGTLTFGSNYFVDAGNQFINACFGTNENGTILFSSNLSTNALRVIAMTVSGTVVTVGASTTIQSTSPVYAQHCNTIAYNPVNQNFLFPVRNTTTGALLGTVLTVTGTTISASAYQSLGSEVFQNANHRINYSTEIGRFIYRAKINGTNAIVSTISVSGTTITRSAQNSSSFGASTFGPAGTLGSVTSAGKLVFAPDNSPSSAYTVNFDPVTFAPTLLVIGSNDAGAAIAAGAARVGSTGYFVAWPNSIQGFSTVGYYIGLANETVSNGQPVKIAVSGGICSSLSGLTVGDRHYVTGTGVITTTASSNAKYLGTAISATSLLLAPGTA